jgi:hypothetical protein
LIRHVVFFKFRVDAPASERSAALDGLRALPAVIDAIETLEVGEDVLRRPRSWDAVLVATYADLDALEAYQVHEAHVVAAAKLRAVCESIGSVDYPVEETVTPGA